MSKFINGKKYEGAIMVNNDGVWTGDINGVWQTAVPLPFYRGWIFIKRYQCECGQKFHSERHYELHYYHDHTNRKIYNRTPKGLVEITPPMPINQREDRT